MNDASSSLDDLLVSARSYAEASPESPAARLVNDLALTVSRMLEREAQLRREAFLDGIRGAAKVIKNRQLAPDSILSELISKDSDNQDRFAEEISRVAVSEPVTLKELRALRRKLTTAEVGNDEIDEDVRRLYYLILNQGDPSSKDVMPPGSPSRSIDLAAFVVERLLAEGWWTLGNSGQRADDKPMANVGLYSDHDSKPQTAATPALALLTALTFTLIQASKD
ncbi:hypothetical protein [Ensifer soli]|uniref:hypothetical protein n=1 Tax=Ciceribacter sp. sgz301302 TaxID=3342379 RepID=UPI0035B93159